MRLLLGRKTACSDLAFMTLTLVIWALLLLLAKEFNKATASDIFFIFTASLMSFVIFKAYIAFDSFRISPRQSDPIFMTLAWVVGALAGEEVTQTLWTNPGVTNLMPVFMTNMPLAFVVYGGYEALSLLAARYERPKTVGLYVTPEQRTILLEELSLLQLDIPIEMISQEQLHQRVMKGLARTIDLIILSREKALHFDSEGMLLRAHLAGIPMTDYQTVLRRVTRRVRLSETDLTSYLLQASEKTLLCRVLLQLKYYAEPLLAALLGIFLSPIMLVIAVAIKLYSPGPIFYVQTRTGYQGKPFKLVKFRSMRVDAEQNGPQWASREDNRVTPFGKFLRRTRLDELPQLWNVIRGEMSFFGPRPERPEIYEMLRDEVPLFSLRTLVRPGVTGWAQVCAGYAASAAESALKLEYDLYYIQHMSLRLDFAILLKTLKIAVYGERHATRPVTIPHTGAIEQT